MLVTTTFELSGWEIQRVCGEVFGLTVRSRNVFSQMGAGFKSMFGGELQGMTKNLTDSRNEAMMRMLEAARAKGGNAVVGFRFDTSELGETWSEICAYGTAVVAVPIDDGARQTAMELGYGQPGPPPTSPDPVQQPYQQPQYQQQQHQQQQYQQPYEQTQAYEQQHQPYEQQAQQPQYQQPGQQYYPSPDPQQPQQYPPAQPQYPPQ